MPSVTASAWGSRVLAAGQSVRATVLMCSAATTNSPTISPVNDHRERIQVCGQELELMNDNDQRCIEERQLTHKISAAAVGARCRHGFPQAFAFHPVKHNVSSGLFRLSCPLLVKAIDEWEREGAIEGFNKRLKEDNQWREGYAEANAMVSSVRKHFVNTFEGGHAKIMATLSEESAANLLNSGIAGVTPTLLDDVKCLHAHLADHLCRGGSTVESAATQLPSVTQPGPRPMNTGSVIGAAVLEGLQERGVPVSGCESCWQQCDVGHQRTADSWWYTPIKNKQKLRVQKERRHEIKQNLKRKAAAAAATAAAAADITAAGEASDATIEVQARD